MSNCERCKTKPCLGKWKYCKECKKAIVAEMKEAGYLQYHYGNHHKGEQRTTEMRENTYETIHGTGH